uniref:Uncharacterized protein n=1 Tax=Alexandrium andersonii TaxID=327968 RepID=A0A7S2CW16_9DINO|mmetsp:Transcript_43661/g.99099  ORF Transcript_43661/g.99099 Transcript_43661/m.99099 type:complete len:423 (+) Transcript_43661:3-1271(+)
MTSGVGGLLLPTGGSCQTRTLKAEAVAAPVESTEHYVQSPSSSDAAENAENASPSARAKRRGELWVPWEAFCTLPGAATPRAADAASAWSGSPAAGHPVMSHWERGAPPLQVPSFAHEHIGTGTSSPSRASSKASMGTVIGIGEEEMIGESRVRRFMRHARRSQTEGARVSEGYLAGDPWSGSEDIEVEDHVEWFMDFFRRRDAVRPERPEDLVTKALAADKPRSRYRKRLEVIVREPIQLLDPFLLEDGKRKSGASFERGGLLPCFENLESDGLASPQPSLLTLGTERSCPRPDSLDESGASTMMPAGACSAFSLASFASSETASESRASLWLNNSPPPSSLGLSEVETTPGSPTRRSLGPGPGRGCEAWELEFIVQCAIDEVWRRLKEGTKTEDISQLLIDTRRHIVTYQVRRQLGLKGR